MAFLINQTGTTLAIIAGLEGLTGNMFTSLLLIVAFLFLICMAFRIPLEFTAIIILPLILTLWAYDAAWTSLGGLLLIYLSVLLMKNFVLK